MKWLLMQLGNRWWGFVFFIYCLLGRPDWSNSHWERRGMRRAIGGRWGRWEIKWGMPFKMWWPSPCEHYPAPPLANSTEPLETEHYDYGDRSQVRGATLQ